eukprot:122229-Rhodomonas_salina.1
MRRRKLRIPDFCAPLSLSPTSSASRNVSLPTAFCPPTHVISSHVGVASGHEGAALSHGS